MKTAKAPAQTFGVSGRYASALWQHANSVGKLETV
jgi:F0F1-type ATP synthase delta subunit